ncbi:MAG: hypothetical protein AAB438_01815 [Patescibacteria group bacterium]
MGKKYLKNFITLFLILSFVTTPYLLFVSEVQAQNTSGYSGQGISGYLKNVGPVVKQLPLCKGKIGGAVKSLFGGAAIGKAGEALGKIGAKLGLTDKIKEKSEETETIPVNFTESTDKKLSEIQRQTTETGKSVSSLEKNDTCLKSIGRMVIKLMLQKITVSTVAWINGGFEGKPLFLQNPAKFFEDVAKNEIRAFALEINDPSQYPFAKDWLKSQVAAYNRKFADNARYSLNELINQTTPQYSALDFNQDFSLGGWNAWTSLSSVPANNSLGFQIMASEEFQARTQGTRKPVAEKIQKALDQANGYLGDERCADPKSVTREMHNAALIEGEKEYSGSDYIDNDHDGISDNGGDNNVVILDPNDNDGDGIPNGLDSTPDNVVHGQATGYIIGTCKKWEYVTPGQMVAEAATKAVNYPDNNLLKADDLNGAIAAILDALVNKWTSDLTAKGFAAFSNEGASGDLVLDYDHINGYQGDSQTEKDFPSYQLGSNWLQEHPDFNIRTDLTQAVIDEQRIYIEKLEKQNIAIQKLIKSTRQLDYCVPGPNPKWEQTSSVDNFYDSIKVTQRNTDLQDTALAIYTAFDITGIFSGIATTIIEKQHETEVKVRIATYLSELFEVHIYGAGGVNIGGGFIGIGETDDGIEKNDFGDRGVQDQVLDEGDIRNLVENTFESYRYNVYRIYFNGVKSMAPMPLVTSESRAEFAKIDGYEQLAEDNFEEITFKKSVIIRLAQIKDAIDALGGINASDDELKSWIAFFGRLTKDMVTGDDIAEADSLLKELISKEEYIYNDLLKGPGGCEEEMLRIFDNDRPAYSKYYRRQPYALPIYYLYGEKPNSTTWGPANPYIHTPWNEYDIKHWDRSEGFLYGMVYYNRWAGPDGDMEPVGGSGPLNSRLDLCPEYIQYPEDVTDGATDVDGNGAYVELSLPSGVSTNGTPIDIGGLEPKGFGNDDPPNHTPDNQIALGKDFRNVCGVVTRKFEKIFGIY